MDRSPQQRDMRAQPGEPGPHNRATTCDAAAGVNTVAEGLGDKLTVVRTCSGVTPNPLQFLTGKGGAWVIYSKELCFLLAN